MFASHRADRTLAFLRSRSWTEPACPVRSLPSDKTAPEESESAMSDVPASQISSQFKLPRQTADGTRSAVGREFARILESRHPGTRWLPVEPTNRYAPSRTGERVLVLPVPKDLDPVRELSATAAGASDVDDVDCAGKKSLALARA
jgi:hypothetical protein